MTQPRKGLTDRPILALYAAAQARADDVEAACRSACKGCPGIEHPNGCHTRKWPRAVAGRADWPTCPMGMLRLPAWRSLVDEYFAAKVAPLEGWPRAYTAWAHDGMLEIRAAANREEARRFDEQTKRGAGGGPNFTGRKSAKRG